MSNSFTKELVKSTILFFLLCTSSNLFGRSTQTMKLSTINAGTAVLGRLRRRFWEEVKIWIIFDSNFVQFFFFKRHWKRYLLANDTFKITWTKADSHTKTWCAPALGDWVVRLQFCIFCCSDHVLEPFTYVINCTSLVISLVVPLKYINLALPAALRRFRGSSRDDVAVQQWKQWFLEKMWF